MKRKHLQKLFAAVLTCTMLASLLTGCGNSKAESTGSSESKQESSVAESTTAEQSSEASEEEEFDVRSITEGKTITIMTPAHAYISDYNDNWATYYLEEALGCDIEFMTIPSEDYADKLNLMVNTGEELPDIIFNCNGLWSSWSKDDVLVELSEYYANPDYCPNITKATEDSGIDIVSYLRDADGNVYGLPRWVQSTNTATGNKMWLYEPWLDKLGVDVPETMDEFYEVCKLVATTDLNENGVQDEIAVWGQGLTGGWSGWFGFMMSPYIYAYDGSFRVVEDGQVSVAYTTDAWKEGLKNMKKFVEEGLLPTEVITQSYDMYTASLYAETPTVFSFNYGFYDGADAQRRLDYVCVPGLKDENGENGYSKYSMNAPYVNGVITTDCEDPLAAFVICDFMCNETFGLILRYGQQGYHWDYWDNVKATYPNAENYATIEGEEPYFISVLDLTITDYWNGKVPQNYAWRQWGPTIILQDVLDRAAILQTATTPEEELALANTKELKEATEACLANRPEEIYDRGAISVKESEAIAEQSSAVWSYVKEMTAAFITGTQDIDTYWDTYLAELDKLGLKDVVEVYQLAYTRSH